jgi:16S rRNA (cytidine1402-2'-O)-methyltransferase
VAGKLYVVATPLGNLEDLSPRAAETLRLADRVLCEDTRRTAKLLAQYGITTPRISCHRFNEKKRLEPILRRLQEGETLALVSDGGTPGISDPGCHLVRAALDAGFEVVPLPGPSAPATLLSVSGIPSDRYLFDGFLPHRAGERRRRLRELRSEAHAVVLFEAPHRIVETLRDIDNIFGERELVLGRELTKRFESILRGSAAQVLAQLGSTAKGEITIVLAGAGDTPGDEADEPQAAKVRECWRAALNESSGDRRAALRAAARSLGMKRAELYRLVVELGEDPDRS